MKKTTWNRKNFLLIAGLSLIGVHLGSMVVNYVAKNLLNLNQKLRDHPE